jgi:fatty-acyl-CoA synthase
MFVPLTPLRCLHRAMDLFGKKTGVVSGDRQFTYAQFGERAERLATALSGAGVRAGDRVAYLSFNNNALMEGYYGVVQAAAIVMPLNVRLSPQELTAILNHAGASMLIFENDFAPLIERLRPLCPSIRRYVTINEKVPAADLTYDELLDGGHAERADIFKIDEMSIAELFYTSGSTGTPKGVMHSHRTLYLHALSVGGLFREVDTMVDLHTIPMFHANGWGRPQASTMLGVTQVMVRRFEPTLVFKLIQQYTATDMSLVPTMANALLNAPDIGEYDLSSMRNVMIGGAAGSPELVQRVQKAFVNAECVSGYGLTETAPVLTSARKKSTTAPLTDQERLQRQSMAGWPVPNVMLRVVDTGMNDVPRDMRSIGEVVAAGDHIMEGYYREPEATSAVMSGPWFHTGDMAVWDDEGYIHIVDRKKEIIISGGENISSLELEKAIFAHPEVYECAVVAAPDDKWGEIPVAVVMRKPGSQLTCEALLDFLSERVGRYKLPRLIEFTDEPLPKTGTGKIKKMLIREQFWAGKEKRVQGG